MQCVDVLDLVEPIAAGDLLPDERVREHLHSCPRCAGALASAQPEQVVFVRNPSSRLLAELYRRALVLVFPAIEDFGIMPVEAMATGTPVVANAIGGTAETVVDGVTGVLVHDWTRGELASAVERAVASDSAACVARARAFDTSVFVERVTAGVASETGTDAAAAASAPGGVRP